MRRRGRRESRDDLVEDEQGARLVARGAERLEEARLGRDDAHVAGDRLDEDRGEVLAVPFHHGLDCVHVVERADDRVGGAAAGTPGEDGSPSVASPDPAAASSASACPW